MKPTATYVTKACPECGSTYLGRLVDLEAHVCVECIDKRNGRDRQAQHVEECCDRSWEKNGDQYL